MFIDVSETEPPARLAWRAVMQRSRHEFQILRDARWDLRLYPTDTSDTYLQPGGRPLPVGGAHGKGHDMNFVLEGSPGTAFDIFFDPTSRTIKCEAA